MLKVHIWSTEVSSVLLVFFKREKLDKHLSVTRKNKAKNTHGQLAVVIHWI